MDALENQFATMNTNSKRPMGSLHGKPEQNPKEFIGAITLRSGKELPSRDLIRDNEKQEGEVIINVEANVVNLDEKKDEEILQKIVDSKGKGKVVEEKKDTTEKGDASTANDTPFVPPPYEPKLPFHGRFKKQLVDKYKALFEKQLHEVQIQIPILDAFMLVPQYNKFLKDAVKEKQKKL